MKVPNARTPPAAGLYKNSEIDGFGNDGSTKYRITPMMPPSRPMQTSNAISTISNGERKTGEFRETPIAGLSVAPFG
jgi:hypothetical protein